MVKVLASRYPMKMTKVQLATFSRLKSSSGTYGTYLSILRGAGYFEEEGELLLASQRALDEFGGDSAPSQTEEDVIAMWRSVLKGGAKRMFDVLVEMSPNGLSKEELAEHSNLIVTSGTFGTYLSTLKSNGLIEINGLEIKLSENIYS